MDPVQDVVPTTDVTELTNPEESKTVEPEQQVLQEMINCDINSLAPLTTTIESDVNKDSVPTTSEPKSPQAIQTFTCENDSDKLIEDVVIKELSIDNEEKNNESDQKETSKSNLDDVEKIAELIDNVAEKLDDVNYKIVDIPETFYTETENVQFEGDTDPIVDIPKAMDVQEQDSDKNDEKVKGGGFDSVLLDENSRDENESNPNPIEEVDPTSKDDSNDGPPDLAAADPLMKDAENQIEGDDDSETAENVEDKVDIDTDPDRITLSVKPPGELLEGNFVDVAEENSLPEDSQMDFDPIETDGEEDSEQIESTEAQPAETADIFNGKEAETILAEDDEVPVSTETEEQPEPEGEATEDENKFVITLANRTESSTCNICAKEEVPQYLAHKNDECECICSTACLDKFKEQHADDYVERILRLRVFAAEETISREQLQLLPAVEPEEINENHDPFRICVICNRCIDVEDYVTWEARDYCDEGCLSASQRSINADCAKCHHLVPENLLGKYCVRFGSTVTQFCKTTCLISYKKARKLCQYCQEDLKANDAATFCSKRCKEAANPNECEPKESGPCSVCRQVKEVELNVRGDEKMDSLCSERCLVAYKFVNKVELVKCVVCPTTFSPKPGDASVYELGTVHSLCSRECQKIFLIINRKIVNCSMCLVKKYDFDMIRFIDGETSTCVCSLTCLGVYFECMYSQQSKLFEPNIPHLELISKSQNYTYEGRDLASLIDAAYNVGKVAVQMIVVTKPRYVPKQKNKAVMCRPRMLTKSIQHKVKERTVHVQTDDTTTRWIPIPVQIFVPVPLHMYVQPVPFPTPIPIPMIIPIFILTGRKSMKGIQKEIAKIKNRIPADPLEAEILMMADMAAGDKRNDPTSDSDDDVGVVPDTTKLLDSSITQMDTASTSFSDDVLSMAFKMANEYTEPLDLESEVDNSTRMLASGKRARIYAPRGRQSSQRMMDIVKPDENLSLKYTFGVNAWKQWASTKNLELQKLKATKFVKLDLLQLSAEDLCFCLCQFIKEVRKPNGAVYASDTIYYLCLGIQLYLYENGRIDNLFCDGYYEKFTDTFNEICLSFCQLYNESQYIVTRVEEEHLWESKQLGAHSPLVLLNTLLFFNTKHFNLITVDDHLQLSFSHIMKHWKRNANAPNQRNVLLRFYPPSKGAWGKRKVYEQQECLENPLRCPVRLYEFFLSKCPESVKARNDVFYLQPERSCVPDSPVWYSTSALERPQLEKMLNRMKMIKEISMAILGT